MWICSNCGQDNNDTASVCSGCGQPLTAQDLGNSGRSGKKRKGIKLLGILAAVVVLAGTALGIFAANSPSVKVMRAAKKTITALREVVGPVDTLKQWVDTFAPLKEAPYIREELALTLEQPGQDTLELSMEATMDPQERRMGGDITLGFPGEDGLTLSIYSDQEKVSFAAPRLLEDVLFAYTYDELAADYNDRLGTNYTGDQFNSFGLQEYAQSQPVMEKAEAVETAMEQLVSNIKVKKTKEQTRERTAYTLVTRPEDRELLASAMEDYWNVLGQKVNMEVYAETLGVDMAQFPADLREFLTRLDDPVVCIDKKGYLSRIRISHMELSLLGQENPWNDWRLSDNGVEALRGSIDAGDGGVCFRLEDGDKDTITLTYKDTDGTFSLMNPEGKTFDGRISASDITLSTQLDAGKLSLSFSMSEGTQAPTPITGSTVYNPFAMTEDDTTALTIKLVGVLLFDREMSQLLTRLGSIFG